MTYGVAFSQKCMRENRKTSITLNSDEAYFQDITKHRWNTICYIGCIFNWVVDDQKSVMKVATS